MKEQLLPTEFDKISKLEDVKSSENYVVFVEKRPNLKNNDYFSFIQIINRKTGRIKKFTNGRYKDYSPRISPNEEKLAFISNRYGLPQLFIMDIKGGESEQITQSTSGINFIEWSPDSKNIAFLSPVSENGMIPLYNRDSDLISENDNTNSKHDPRIIRDLVYRTGTKYKDSEKFIHVFNYSLESASITQVSDGDFRHSDFTWNSNSTIVCLSRRSKPRDLSTEYTLLEFNISSKSFGKALTKVNNRSIDRYLPGPKAYPNGPIITPKLSKGNLSGQVLKWGILQPDGTTNEINKKLDRTITQVKWISSDQAIVSIENEGKVELRLLNVQTAEFAVLSDHQASIESFDSFNTNLIYFISTDPLHPSCLWKYENNEITVVYDPNANFLSKKHLIVPEELWITNPEGEKFHGWFFDASNEDNRKPPLILSIHGGPHFMWNNAGTMWFEWQTQVNAGYSVLAMNPIGSGGYGEKFTQLIRSSWGDNDARDLLLAVDKITSRVDENRLYLTGGSYAGFQTANIISRDDRFKAAVSQRGVYNLTNFWTVTDIPVWYTWEWEGEVYDEGMLEKLWNHSPVGRAKHINTPLLILHSENDFRVSISQAEELFTALRIQDKEVVFVRYPREGHDLSRSGEPAHIIDRLERIIEWFETH